jgi:glycosyltransferase involved in cell wall biosynthesis
MTELGSIFSLAGVLASLFWLTALAGLWRGRKQVVQLADWPADEPPGGWPALSVIFAARDEAEHVEKATRSLLAQDYPVLEVVAVDDRSADETGAILDRLGDGDARLRVVHIRDLPAGWLGKNHALQAAADASRAEWLLLTDADVVFVSTALRRAIGFATFAAADHVTAVPEMPTETVGERLFLAMFDLIFFLHSPTRKVHDASRRAALGIGAFNLVRAEAFHAIGGFRRLALSVDDDMRLGQALKWAGYRSRVVLGLGAVSVRWHVGAAAIIRGLEKNFFAGMEFRVGGVALGIMVVLWVGAAPHVGLFVGPWWARFCCALGVGAIAAILHQVGRSNRVAWPYALSLPISALACCYAIVRSAWITLRQRGIRWRGHHYHLAELRAHVRQRAEWLRELWRSTR